MKKFIIAILLLNASAAIAQTTQKVVRKTMTGAEYTRMMPKVIDHKIYDQSGNVVDSVKARQMLKSFDYEMSQVKEANETEYKNVIYKVNHEVEDRRDKPDFDYFKPASRKLWAGVTLDLTPLAKHTDISKLDGKAIVLLFYIGASGYKTMYDGINDAVENSIAGNKFEVLAITRLDYVAAKNAQKTVPILNAHHIVDAQDVIDFYDIQNHAVIVVTNAQHQITYAAKDGPAMVPRTLNKLLKAL